MTTMVAAWGKLTMEYDEKRRLVFGDVVDKMFWAVISGFLFWIGMSIMSLNEKMAIVVTQITYEARVNAEQSQQIKELEKELRKSGAR
jgi:hypothetical protein